MSNLKPNTDATTTPLSTTATSKASTTYSGDSSPAPTPDKTTAQVLYELELTNINEINNTDYDISSVGDQVFDLLNRPEDTATEVNKDKEDEAENIYRNKDYVEIPNIPEKTGWSDFCK